MITDRRVAIKVIRKDRIQRMEQRQGPMNEDPRKEMATMHWVTEQMRNGSPRLRGDVSRVLPLIEVLEDSTNFYQVNISFKRNQLKSTTVDTFVSGPPSRSCRASKAICLRW